MITIQETTIERHLEDYRRYANSLRLIDTYWEDNIWFATLYEIRAEDQIAGCFSVLADSNMLSSYFLFPQYKRLLRPAFQKILNELRPRGAYVVSGDEPFLSVCTDFTCKIIPHAYFFDSDGQADEPPAYPESWLRWAEESDRSDLEKTGFYHPVVLHDEENQIFVLRNERGHFLGTGHIARMRLCRQWGCVGMYTNPAFRRKGVGRSIILPLIDWTKQQGLIPIAGCKFENRASRHTLQSCGMSSRTRYLQVLFE